MQGPAELLPVSSSGHLVLLPALLGSPYARLDPELRKSFEVALHLGAAAALLVASRKEVGDVLRPRDPTRAVGVALTCLPAAAAALAFERPIEERLGSVRRVAVAQIAAGIALAAADRRPAVRPREDADELDHLAVGLGQAAALVPGVSRAGATLTAARLRRLDRPAASLLSRRAALPVVLGAAALKALRLARRGLPAGLAGPFAAGAGAAFASTLAAIRLASKAHEARSYAPFAAYRVALGLAALAAAGRRPPGAGLGGMLRRAGAGGYPWVTAAPSRVRRRPVRARLRPC